MDVNVTVNAVRRGTRRIRACLNPNCGAGGHAGVRVGHDGEYLRLSCPACGAVTVYNAVGAVAQRARQHVWVKRDGNRGVVHLLPKSAERER